MHEKINFPQFRKYKNGQSFFRIESPEKFIELKRTAQGFEKYIIEAKILPDRNLIMDMLVDYEKYWDRITEEEFEDIHAQLTS